MTQAEFLDGVTNFDNHRHLLWEALELTKDVPGPVVEMGMGHGSTPYLAKYCKDESRELFSYENNRYWYDRCLHFHKKTFHIIDWDHVAETHLTPAVLFIDHAPGERRKIDLANFALRARVIVIHDSEPAADHGYQMRQHIPLFKYWKDFQSEGAWASMASNFIAF